MVKILPLFVWWGRKHSLLKEGGMKVWRGPVYRGTLAMGKLRQVTNVSSLTTRDEGVMHDNCMHSMYC